MATAASAEHPRILSIGTANPPRRYTQQEVLELLGVSDSRTRGLFLNSHILTRHLYLPEPRNGHVEPESQEELIAKHKRYALELGSLAVQRCLKPLGMEPKDIDYLACVSSTGYLCPGISAFLIKNEGFRDDIHRVDVLGMGCNAGMNTLNPVSSFARGRPGRFALMVCAEICSAAYVHDGTFGTAIVNSLFGDGVVAVLLRAGEAPLPPSSIQGPHLLDFESLIVTEAIHTMRFDLWKGRLSFFLDRDIPYYIGASVERPVYRLLERNGLKKRDIKHWVIHSGGRKVIDSIKYNIGLTDYDVRHTLSILREYGNLSSGSFLFSLKRLQEEGATAPGDYGVLMAMGPGASIETALVQW